MTINNNNHNTILSTKSIDITTPKFAWATSQFHEIIAGDFILSDFYMVNARIACQTKTAHKVIVAAGPEGGEKEIVEIISRQQNYEVEINPVRVPANSRVAVKVANGRDAVNTVQVQLEYIRTLIKNA